MYPSLLAESYHGTSFFGYKIMGVVMRDRLRSMFSQIVNNINANHTFSRIVDIDDYGLIQLMMKVPRTIINKGISKL